jgi:hypothetical protein
MASRGIDALKVRGTHNIGALNSLKIKTLANGALVDEANGIDNFTMVELAFDANGERTCKQLAGVDHKTYLIATIERRLETEELVDFYNANGEMARIVIPEDGLRFQSSAYSLNAGVNAVDKGQIAHFDPTTKKYIISAANAPHADYATSNVKLLVVSDEEDLEYTAGKTLVRFEVQ